MGGGSDQPKSVRLAGRPDLCVRRDSGLSVRYGRRRVARISATVIGAIAQARAHAKQFGIDNELRVILQHCDDMHDLLIEGLLRTSLSTEYLRGIATSTYNQIEQLAALATMQDWRLQ